MQNKMCIYTRADTIVRPNTYTYTCFSNMCTSCLPKWIKYEFLVSLKKKTIWILPTQHTHSDRGIHICAQILFPNVKTINLSGKIKTYNLDTLTNVYKNTHTHILKHRHKKVESPNVCVVNASTYIWHTMWILTRSHIHKDKHTHLPTHIHS